ncbi:MAG: hypothetical protein ACLFM0_08455 [Spirochaetales bacterium]
MRRVLICAALLATAFASPLLADTVMVHFYADLSEEYSDDEAATQLISAVEDGVMFEMFEGGHIVFNTVDRSVRFDTEEAIDSGEDESVDWVMIVDLGMERVDEAFSIERARYRAVDVDDEAVYLEREVDSGDLEQKSDESADEAARRIGSDIGAEFLEEL